MARLFSALLFASCATTSAALDAPDPDTDDWAPGWVWRGAGVQGDAVEGFGSQWPSRGDPAATVARRSAAGLILSTLSRDPPRFDEKTESRLLERLARTATIAKTYTASTGVAFAQAHLRVEDSLEILAQTPGWRASDADTVRRELEARAGRVDEVKRTPPAWVSAAPRLDRTGPPKLVAAGRAFGIINLSLSRSTADNRARSEIAKLFSALIHKISRHYSDSTTPTDFVEEELYVLPPTRSWAELSGVQIVDHWFDLRRHAYYARAELDLGALLDAAARAEDPKVRAAVEAVIARFPE